MTAIKCTHHFIIPTPNGNSSIGTCKLCGFKKEMFNYFEGKLSPWLVNANKKNTNKDI